MEAAARRLLLIGWDGADWDCIHPLLDRGELPNLQRLVESGVTSRLSKTTPPVPAQLWTSIVTGKTPDQHGILDGLEPDSILGGARAASSLSRKTKALWNILGQTGARVHAVNWPASHPAEPIHGVCVSDAFCRARSIVEAGAIHPAALEPMLTELRIQPEDLSGDEVRLFVPHLGEIDQARDRRVVKVAALAAEAITAHGAATWILEAQPWDFLAVRYGAIATARDLYAGVAENVYRFLDLLLGRLLQLAGDDATVMLVSESVFCLSGPDLRRDELIYGAGALDIAPTVLALFGLPLAAEMPGRALLEAWEVAPALPPPAGSWDDVPGTAGMHPPPEPSDADFSRAAWEELAALGYQDPRAAERAQAAEVASARAAFQLGRSLLGQKRAGEAIAQFEQAQIVLRGPLLELYLSYACLLAGDLARSRRLADAVDAREPGLPFAHLLRAGHSLSAGDHAAALEHLRLAESVAQPSVQSLLLGARAYLLMGSNGNAERAFRRALALDDQSAIGWQGLASTLVRRKRYQEAVAAALEAIGLDYAAPESHYALGFALAATGERERAQTALRVCLQLQPHHRQAARLLRRLERDARAAA